MTDTQERLHKFVGYCREHITGDEKGEAQSFLDRFFRAFGHEGAIEAGAVYEKRIEKGSKKGKTGFADLVWKPRVLIEMKKRGAVLSKHYSQAFDYWQRAVPNRPRYVMLCNFDEFWVYDFDTQIDTPIDMVPLEQLPERVATFGFMEVQEKQSVFGNNQVEVTEKAAGRMGELYQMLRDRLLRQGLPSPLAPLPNLGGRPSPLAPLPNLGEGDMSEAEVAALIAQRYVLQCVLAMFAEDRRLLPDSLFVQCVQECLSGGGSAYDILGGLFREMNTPGITPAGRYQGVDYFNGGLFAEIYPLDLTPQELKFLEVSALEDWSKVRPAIFGNIFESAIDEKDRHAHGIHYTSEADIMKIVRPTISRYWEERIEQANTIGQLETLQLELQNYRVLDPACGSGNFLYIAYQELKQIEQDLLDKIAERRRSPRDQMQMSFVTPLQFFGLDNNPFAVELARVTLMIARKVAVDRLGLYEATLPLDTLDQNIRCEDALFTEWPKADAIIGNPPFLGGHWLRQELGDDYTERLFTRFSNIQNQQVDFASYWFRLAQDHIPQSGRAGLVATNSISQGKGRIEALDYILKNDGTIHDAISTQPWSGEAKVHVSIVNWMKGKPKELYLDNRKVNSISSSLKAHIDVSKASKLKANKNMSFRGVEPNGMGFFITEEDKQKWIDNDFKNAEVIKLFSMGANLAQNPHGLPDRWIIDFDNKSLEEAANFTLPFERVKTIVKPIRDENRRETRRLNWWKYGENAPRMRASIGILTSCFALPRVSKWSMFITVPTTWLLGDKSVSIASEDFYILGVLVSSIHQTWITAQSSTLKGDTAYTPTTCFETFPFPQTPSAAIAQKIRDKALELHEYRSTQMEQKRWGITKLYNAYFDEPASQLYKLHKELDALVLEAYGFGAGDDLLERLLALNLELAEREKAGEAVVGPWDPSGE